MKKTIFFITLVFCTKSFGIIHVFPDSKREPYISFIQKAKISLDMMIYVLDDRKITKAILEAHKRGVKVRIIVEKKKFLHSNSQSNSNSCVQTLKKNGVEIHTTPSTVNQLHAKIMLRDKKAVLLSTGNLDAESFDGIANGDFPARDFALEELNPDFVHYMHSIFACDWKGQKCLFPKFKNIFVAPYNYRTALNQMIRRAQNSIDIYQQDITDPQIQSLLLSSLKRGVKVRLIMTPFPFGGKIDKNKRFQAEIESLGGKVKRITNPYIHTKILIIDNTKVFLGTSNFFTPSLNKNREIGTCLRNKDDIQIIKDIFAKDWAPQKDSYFFIFWQKITNVIKEIF